jgi:hypothetical protein
MRDRRADALETFADRVVGAAEAWRQGAGFPDDVAMFVCEVGW